MTQALYAHMNNKTIKKNIHQRKDGLFNTMVVEKLDIHM
jgi:hypothetical protein